MARGRRWQERVRQAHAAWVNRHVGAAPYDPDRDTEGSDYNLHHLDVDATPEQEDAFWSTVDAYDRPGGPAS